MHQFVQVHESSAFQTFYPVVTQSNCVEFLAEKNNVKAISTRASDTNLKINETVRANVT